MSLSNSAKKILAVGKNKLISGTIEGAVSKFANSAHIILPKDWIGKKVRVSVIEDEEKKE